MTARARLLRAWAALDHVGATVRSMSLAGFDDHEVNALAWEAEHRLRVIAEGRQVDTSVPGAAQTAPAPANNPAERGRR